MYKTCDRRCVWMCQTGLQLFSVKYITTFVLCSFATFPPKVTKFTQRSIRENISPQIVSIL